MADSLTYETYGGPQNLCKNNSVALLAY